MTCLNKLSGVLIVDFLQLKFKLHSKTFGDLFGEHANKFVNFR